MFTDTTLPVPIPGPTRIYGYHTYLQRTTVHRIVVQLYRYLVPGPNAPRDEDNSQPPLQTCRVPPLRWLNQYSGRHELINTHYTSIYLAGCRGWSDIVEDTVCVWYE